VVTWTVTDTSGNTATCKQNVTVQDHEKPQITCPADLPDVSTDAGLCTASGVSLGTPATSDNCAVDTVTSDAPSTFPKGLTVVTWTVTDTSGNTATCKQNVTVQDHEKPKITCPADLADVSTDANGCTASGVNLGTPTTSDNCAVSTVTNDAPATFPKGLTIVTWTVTDSSGNTATCKQNVTVNDHEDPKITCPTDLPNVSCDPGACTASGVSLGTPTTSDNCAVATVTSDAPATFPKGLTIVT